MLEYIKIRGRNKIDKAPEQSKFKMHMHNSYEILCFLTGDAKYVVEGNVYPLRKGDFMLMRRSESHHLCLLSNAVYRRMNVNFVLSDSESPLAERILRPFEERTAGKLNHYPSVYFPNSDLYQHYMEKICSESDYDVQSAYLTALLCEFSECFEKLKKLEDTSEIDMTADIIQYINAHITEEVSLQRISEHFFISKSQLNRNFKRVMGSTVGEYILTKRLLQARGMIEEGENPTKIYQSCGFNDYTSFYRAYCAKFGFSPSKTKG